MHIEYHKEYSKYLNRGMEFKVYGHGGKPLIMIPTQCNRFYEFENKKMLDVYAPFIEDGKVQVFAIDSLDDETYITGGDCRGRIWWYEQWINYVVYEAVPRFSQINPEARNGAKFAVVGESMGGLHASTLFFRFPDIFDAVMCLSGLYSNEYYMGAYHDDLTYANSPQQFLKNMPADHPYIDKYRDGKIIICVGQGAWERETKDSTLYFKSVLEEKQLGARIEVWGEDVFHDWDWWFVQTAYFLPDLLSL